MSVHAIEDRLRLIGRISRFASSVWDVVVYVDDDTGVLFAELSVWAENVGLGKFSVSDFVSAADSSGVYLELYGSRDCCSSRFYSFVVHARDVTHSVVRYSTPYGPCRGNFLCRLGGDVWLFDSRQDIWRVDDSHIMEVIPDNVGGAYAAR